jgi:tRNA nucleotidyltransferase (CCA-adding enzyme)
MAVTTRRPVIGPQQSSAYVYLHGQFFWSLDFGRHTEILTFLENQGISREEINQGVFGAIYNVSEDEVPDYINEQGSDMLGTQTNPTTLAECKRKLQALFPDLRDQTGYNVTSNEEYQGAPKFDIGDSVIFKGYGDKGWVRNIVYVGLNDWQYIVRRYDDEGIIDDVLAKEDELERTGFDLYRGPEMDQPSAWKMQDLGIPPEAEDYYRTSSFNVGDSVAVTPEALFYNDQMTGIDGEVIDIEYEHGQQMYRVRWFHPKDMGFETLETDNSIVPTTPDPLSNPKDQPGDLTIPWSDEEQNYYRNAATVVEDHDGWYTATIGTAEVDYSIFPDSQAMHKNRNAIEWPVEHGPYMKPDDGGPVVYIHWIGTDNPLDEESRPTPQDAAAAIQFIRHFDLPIYADFSNETLHAFFERRFKAKMANNWPKVRKYAIIDGMDEPLATDSLTQELSNNPSAKTAFERLSAAGGQVYVVGGAVRDALMGKSPKDIDLMVAGLTGDQIVQTLKGEGAVNLTGKDFGVYRFKAPGASDEVEIALPRSERSTGSGHKDFEVNADPFLDPSVDLSRRDFTINAMAWHPETSTFLDPHGGMNDLKQGNLSLVSDNAFEDDPLRIVRALVATARYGFTPDSALVESMQEHASAIRHLPGERIQMELDKLLSAPDPAQAFELAEQTGVLDYIAPELSGTVGFDQRNPHHNLDVFKHTMQVLRVASTLSNDPDLRLAALFHDSGKPDSFWLDPHAPEGGGGHFYKKRLDDGSDIGQDHEQVGGDLVTEFMNRLRYPKKRIERVETLVRNHMFPYFNSAKGARKFLRFVDNDPKTAFDLLNLRQADASGKVGGEMNEYDTEALAKSRALVTQVLDEGENISKTDLAINGHDLIQLGYKPGPQFREILNRLHDAVIEDPSLNNRDDLLGLLNR